METFLDLWRAQPSQPALSHAWLSSPVGGVEAGMQAADRLNEALARTGAAALAGQRGADAARIAQSLRVESVPGFATCQILKSPGVRAFLAAAFSTPGLIYARSGDEQFIDLWNGYRSTTRGLAEWTGWLEDSAKSGQPSEIWFWPAG
jgi:hypothetical protein